MQKSTIPGSSTSHAATSHTVVAVVTLHCPGGEQCVRSLYDGHDLLVGSEPSADLRASGDGVAAMHCLVRAKHGVVSVRDCYSPTGTFLDEKRVTEAEIRKNGVIRVGPFTLDVVLSSSPKTADPTLRPELAVRTAGGPAVDGPHRVQATSPEAGPAPKSTPMNSSEMLRTLLAPQFGTPMAPAAPVAPVAPVAPAAPLAAVAPLAPAAPVAPAAPLAAVAPLAPAAPVAPLVAMAPVASVVRLATDPATFGAAPTGTVNTAPAPKPMTSPRPATTQTEGNPAKPAAAPNPGLASVPVQHTAIAAPRSPAAVDSAAKSPPQETGAADTSLRSQLEQARAEISTLRDCLNASRYQPSVSADDPWQAEMIELLRAEVLELQSVVAAFNASTAGPGPGSGRGSGAPDDSSDLVSRDDAERLVERLEHLLDELQQRDEQVRLLNDLLEAAENANRAEQDERRQLNDWVGDIERRIALREEEWQAERQKLVQNLERLKAERDRAEATVAADTVLSRNDAMQRVMNGLRAETETLRQSLAESDASCARLRRELDEASRKDFREEEVKLAQERAELARMRHELETARQAPEKRTELSDSNLRFQALRQHLNEVHVKDKSVRGETKLGSRISRLWNILEGK